MYIRPSYEETKDWTQADWKAYNAKVKKMDRLAAKLLPVCFIGMGLAFISIVFMTAEPDSFWWKPPVYLALVLLGIYTAKEAYIFFNDGPIKRVWQADKQREANRERRVNA